MTLPIYVPALLFQSTLPRGERQSRLALIKDGFEFQSTLPRGERHISSVYFDLAIEFQSTLPRGERLACRGNR